MNCSAPPNLQKKLNLQARDHNRQHLSEMKNENPKTTNLRENGDPYIAWNSKGLLYAFPEISEAAEVAEDYNSKPRTA